MKKIIPIITFLFIFMLFISCLTTYVVYSGDSFITSSTDYYFSATDFAWPLPNNHTISSDFGVRVSPTNGASSYHSGIDIPAVERN